MIVCQIHRRIPQSRVASVDLSLEELTVLELFSSLRSCLDDLAAESEKQLIYEIVHEFS